MTIYRNTLTVPKPVYGIDSEKEPLTLDGFEIKRPNFEIEKMKSRRSEWTSLLMVTTMW